MVTKNTIQLLHRLLDEDDILNLRKKKVTLAHLDPEKVYQKQ